MKSEDLNAVTGCNILRVILIKYVSKLGMDREV